MRNPFAASFFVFVLALGLWLNDRSWDGQVFVYVGEDRGPAAVRNLEEYSALDHRALSRTVQTQLLAEANILRADGKVGLQLGHPLVLRNGGGRSFGCQAQARSGVYDRIELTFVGTGVSADGELPKMIVDSQCKSENDLNHLDPIWIPVAQILSAPAKDAQFTVQENDVRVRLQSIPDQWPSDWVLWSVRLYRTSSPEQTMTIDTEHLRQARPHLLSLNWKDQK